jgi:predicted AlkP superfamily pyrophosphatase or phosphodiesterase
LWIVAGLYANTAQAATPGHRMVIVISLDGFPAYALKDPRLPIPTLRKLAREGSSAAAMQPINPTVTWPNHTAMVTGVDASRHHVLANGLLVHQPDGSITVEPWRDKDLLVRAPTIYDAAYQAGLTTAQVDWVAIYGARTITWSFPEMPDPKGLIENELVADGLVTTAQLADFDASSPAWQDEIRTEAAIDILKRYKPDLMLLHLLSLDDTNHAYGPMSDASLEAMAFLDDRVKQIVDTVQSQGLSDRATILVVSDHGFRKIQHTINPNVALRANGFAHETGGKTSWDAWVLPSGGAAMVYVARNARRTDSLTRLKTLFAHMEGVERVYEPSELAKLGLVLTPPTDDTPDLVVAAKPGYGFGHDDTGDLQRNAPGGTHGYLNSDSEMQAIFLAWGAGIRPGIRLDTIPNVDVAPTIAALLSIEMKNVTGHALNEILTSPSTR